MLSLQEVLFVAPSALPSVMVPCIGGGERCADNLPPLDDYSTTVPANTNFPVDSPFALSGKTLLQFSSILRRGSEADKRVT